MPFPHHLLPSPRSIPDFENELFHWIFMFFNLEKENFQAKKWKKIKEKVGILLVKIEPMISRNPRLKLDIDKKKNENILTELLFLWKWSL